MDLKGVPATGAGEVWRMTEMALTARGVAFNDVSAALSYAATKRGKSPSPAIDMVR